MDPIDTASGPPASSGPFRSRSIKAVLLAVSSMTVMAGAIISPALPAMNEHFAARSELMVKLILTMPALMIVVFGPLAGALADRYARKPLLAGALLLYATAGVAGFVLDSLEALLVSRALLGIAVAAIMSISLSLIGDYFRARERAAFMGFQGSFMSLGGVLFVNLGGALAEWSWRGPFLVYLAALLVLPPALRLLFEPQRESATVEAGAAPVEGLDLRRVGLVYAMAFLALMVFYMVPTQLPFLLVERTGVSGLALGVAISSATLTSALASLAYGRIAGVLSYVGIYIVGLSVMSAGYIVVGMASGYGVMVAGVSLSGIGFGLLIPNGNLWLMALVPSRLRGRVIGGLSSMIFLGQFLSPLVAAPLTDTLGLGPTFLVAAAVLGGSAASMALGLMWFRHWGGDRVRRRLR